MFTKLKSLLYNNEVRAILFQILAVVVIAYFAYQAFDNMMLNIEQRGIRSGFGFLNDEAGFAVNDNFFLEYSPASTNLQAFYVGIVNTLIVAITGIFFASVLGLIVGISRLSSNYLIRKMATVYIEVFRNIPILLQILFWYSMALSAFPSPKNSISFFDSIFLNSRGLYLPRPVEGVEIYLVLASFIIGVVSYIFIKRRSNKKHDDTGIETNTTPYFAGLVLLLPIAVYFASGAQLEYPVLKGFNFRGGVDLSIEFFALAFALSIYTATYIAEAIRSGIESVDNGQKEAAAAMGLTQTQSLRLVVLPQALRVAIPPIINQYLNLTKNSSLAAAVGYTELVTIFSGTVLNVVGQAIEIIILTMLVYLAISLVISLILNIFNKKMQIKGK
ncbi:MAG: ABC transporter permease subunit [Candidatus Thioglobus sp.]|uniref:amino acid ABC transporter permease n=1 Tax=Candidatus Thioglobus sp. TaxID=2026721 RepID=UPI001D7F10D5|nr:ABC transporter permease subunit [Candidatus Thioglobus sp.]MBT3277372.1 ABC transporter permease subunit [Candidatus Thioglobus sp.]MBT3447022.1 ABC transporter permease subunit [Candidatus Thioglobus sp.]MBT3745213.1 ABC transporter permease subunit [Candidatus Thioglobus sp.]MBT4421910.1 ABC transporter permease subunit [Candidatus Thioglobus sp.]MBT5164297.1 ABC transporter permease subunit [Candidatus Thioglobus sp.]